MTVLNSVDN